MIAANQGSMKVETVYKMRCVKCGWRKTVTSETVAYVESDYHKQICEERFPVEPEKRGLGV